MVAVESNLVLNMASSPTAMQGADEVREHPGGTYLVLNAAAPSARADRRGGVGSRSVP